MLSIPSLVERHIPYQSTSLVEQTPYSLVMDQSAAIPFDKALVDYLDAMETNPESGKCKYFVKNNMRILTVLSCKNSIKRSSRSRRGR